MVRSLNDRLCRVRASMRSVLLHRSPELLWTVKRPPNFCYTLVSILSIIAQCKPNQYQIEQWALWQRYKRRLNDGIECTLEWWFGWDAPWYISRSILISRRLVQLHARLASSLTYLPPSSGPTYNSTKRTIENTSCIRKRWSASAAKIANSWQSLIAPREINRQHSGQAENSSVHCVKP